MESFLYTVAKRIVEEHGDDMLNTTVVFNNRRAGLFLRKAIAQVSDKTSFLPKTIGMDDLIAELSGYEIEPTEFILFELFDIHRNLKREDSKYNTLEEFMPLAEMMISDFSQIDLYRVDTKQLFDNLHEIKKIGEWDISGTALTPFQRQYLDFYHSLYDYYDQLHTRLDNQGKAYSGMAYRKAADMADSMVDNYTGKHIYFVGFNALSACEESIIDTFVKRLGSTVIFDGDKYYIDDPAQEAGRFLRQFKGKYAGNDTFENHFANEKKKITIVECPETVLQAKTAGTIVDKLSTNHGDASDNTLEKTAIVLADEKMLVPVLNSLPARVEKSNVTMGYPFQHTEANELMLKLLSLYSSIRDNRYHHSELTSFLGNHTIRTLIGNEGNEKSPEQIITEEKTVYASPERIQEMLVAMPEGEQLSYLFADKDIDTPTILNNARRLTCLIIEKNELSVKEKEACACLLQTIDYLTELEKRYQPIDKIATLQKIYIRIAQRRSIAFYGEPLTGLQIIGMLETRSLDFDNIILLSANESVLPSGKTGNSLIPLTLKRAFGIPTFEEHDAVYANHFYRLLQRAKNVFLIYSSENEGTGKGEPSRFILQMRDELAHRFPDTVNVENISIYASSNSTSTKHPVSIEKSEHIQRRLESMAAPDKGFSPSALNNYRNCTLKFYFENILGIRENNELNDEIESNELGDCIHSILSVIYSKDTNGEIKSRTLKGELEKIGTTVDKYFEDNILHGRENEGKNKLYAEVAKTQLKHFLKKEISYLESGNRIKILLLEEPLRHAIATGHSSTATIQGKADRIDMVEGRLRVVDYKSGSVKNEEMLFDDNKAENMSDKWFQVLTYAWLYHRCKGGTDSMQTGIFHLRDLSSSFKTAKWNGEEIIDNEKIDRFEEMLVSLVGEIMNPDVPFTAKPRNVKACNYCSFSRICNKE